MGHTGRGRRHQPCRHLLAGQARSAAGGLSQPVAHILALPGLQVALGLGCALLPSTATGGARAMNTMRLRHQGPRHPGRQSAQVSRGLSMPSTKNSIWVHEDCLLPGYTYARVEVSALRFIAAGSSGDGSLVRGHTTTVAWPGSVGRCIESNLALCRSGPWVRRFVCPCGRDERVYSVAGSVCDHLQPRGMAWQGCRDWILLSEIRRHTHGCKDLRTGCLVLSAHPGSNRSGYIIVRGRRARHTVR